MHAAGMALICRKLHGAGSPGERGQLPGSAARLAQANRIRLHGLFFTQSIKSLAEELGGSFMRWHHDPVVHPFALAPRGNNSCATQISQMARDLWLGRTQNFHEITDTNFTVAHQVEQTKPRSVAERLEETGQVKWMFCQHIDIFALTNLTVKDIFTLANMFGETLCQSNYWNR